LHKLKREKRKEKREKVKKLRTGVLLGNGVLLGIGDWGFLFEVSEFVLEVPL